MFRDILVIYIIY